MDFTKVIEKRRAIRKYKPDPVPEEVLQKLYEAIGKAPSGNNHQPYEFIFVTDPEKRHRIAAEACHQDFLFQAPVLMIACCEKEESFDTAIAVDHMVLAATNEGLGTCWVGWFERGPVRNILGIPDTLEIPILVSIGYADEQPEPKVRKPLNQLIKINKY